MNKGSVISYISYKFTKNFQRLSDLIERGFELANYERDADIRAEDFLASTESVESRPDNEREIVSDAIVSYKKAKKAQVDCAAPYKPGGGWTNSGINLPYDEQLSSENLDSAALYLRNFFRNESISGLWNSRPNPFLDFSSSQKEGILSHSLRIYLANYFAWEESLEHPNLEELDSPRVGNPWGYVLKNNLLHPAAFEYNFHAHYVDNLLTDVSTPVILEIGGGFGGLAYQLLRFANSARYVGFDLPEKIILQTYYLSCIYPNKKIFKYDGSGWPREPENYDVILLPNFLLNQVPDGFADAVLNFRSLSEMSEETIAEYLKQVDRIGRLYFYHENIYKEKQGPLHRIPTGKFPPLNSFELISSSESRWLTSNSRSSYPCHDNLLIKRDVLRK